jgi:hypothetical protein
MTFRQSKTVTTVPVSLRVIDSQTESIFCNYIPVGTKENTNDTGRKEIGIIVNL